jgi:hypothetical protein
MSAPSARGTPWAPKRAAGGNLWPTLLARADEVIE